MALAKLQEAAEHWNSGNLREVFNFGYVSFVEVLDGDEEDSQNDQGYSRSRHDV